MRLIMRVVKIWNFAGIYANLMQNKAHQFFWSNVWHYQQKI